MEMKITWSTLAKQQLKDDFRTNLFARGGQGSRKICVHQCNLWDNVKNQKFLGYVIYFPYICSV